MPFEPRPLSPFFAPPFGPSPFAPAQTATPVVNEADATYVLVPSAPAVAAEECETAETAAEVEIRWGHTVLAVSHLNPPRSFHVGEAVGPKSSCDYHVPADKLGAERLPLLLVAPGRPTRVVVPPNGTLRLTSSVFPTRTLADVVAAGQAQPSASAPGAFEVELPEGATAEVGVADLTFRVGLVRAGRAVEARAVDTAALPFHAGSLLAHAGLLAAIALFIPPLGATADGDLSAEQSYRLGQLLNAVAEKETEPEKDASESTKDDGNEGGQGAQAKLESGSMGSQVSRDQNKGYAVAGPKDNPDPHLARVAAIDMAREFGMVGLLAGQSNSMNAPTAPWGRDEALGTDALSARGNLWGESLGEAAGAGGLGLSGVGEGGGSRYEGIGLGRIGTLGRGDGGGDAMGIGKGHGHLQATHTAKPPVVRTGTLTASGRIPPEVIQRTVRQSFGRFRFCYENGLRTSPNLAGRVTVRFVIGRDGAVSNASNGGSDLPDAGVLSCVVRAFYGLSFPAPEAGIVTVSYPITFSPGG